MLQEQQLFFGPERILIKSREHQWIITIDLHRYIHVVSTINYVVAAEIHPVDVRPLRQTGKKKACPSLKEYVF